MLPIYISAVALGGVAGAGYHVVVGRRRLRKATLEAKAVKSEADKQSKDALRESQNQAKDLIREAKREASHIERTAKADEAERRRAISATEQQLSGRQSNLDRRTTELDRRAEKLREAEVEIEAVKEELRGIRARQRENLEKLAGLTKSEARDKLMKLTERDIRNDLTGLVSKLQEEARVTADEQAQMIIATAMERMAGDQTVERTVTTVVLPSEDMKGRIIGKEGRNIQAFEKATGVDIIIDESPGAIVLSSFDPVRRQVARLALEKLISDGRIHPGRIEELVAKAEKDIKREAREAAEKAIKETGVVGIPTELVQLLGELKFRTSFSQNVLGHSTEMAHLAGMIAREIGADVRVAKTAALLHDVGKAVSHEVEGGHHHIGGELAERYGMDPAIVHAITAHHDDVEATTPEALVVRVVDALSAARPGVRGDNFENYARRMTELENLAKTFPGIHKTYAISAGRELRVIVRPDKIDDYAAVRLAQSIAKKVEAQLKYPGVIKVNVIRETRATEFAK